MAKHREEEFSGKHVQQRKKIDIHRVKKVLNEGWTGAIFYSVLGIVFAFLFSKGLGVALNTDTPVVAVLSPSMQHDNPEMTFYGWLEKNGYTRSEIDSWPISNGFLIGDMPIVAGESEYRIGEIIVYSVSQESYPIIHRIVKISPDGTYQTKGDNNMQQFTYELNVKKEQIHGKVVFVLPKLGYLKVFATQIFGA